MYSPGKDILESLGLSPIISATGTVTAYGGSRLRPEVMDAMNRASNSMVNMDELNAAVGKQIAAVINFSPKQIGPFMSECLVLGFPDRSGEVTLITTDQKVPNGGKLF